MTILVVCTHCGRHARASTTCDFCGAELGSPVLAARKRSSRAVAFGAVAALGIACGARTELGGVVTEGDADAKASSDAAEECPPSFTVYGGPPPCTDASRPPPKDGGSQQDVTVVPPYGSHFPPDADEDE